MLGTVGGMRTAQSFLPFDSALDPAEAERCQAGLLNLALGKGAANKGLRTDKHTNPLMCEGGQAQAINRRLPSHPKDQLKVFAVCLKSCGSIDNPQHSAKVGFARYLKADARLDVQPALFSQAFRPWRTLAPQVLVMSEKNRRDQRELKNTREHARADCAKVLELVKQVNAIMTEKERRKRKLLFGPPQNS